MVKFTKNRKCPFYRPSGVFTGEIGVNIMHRNVEIMQFYTKAGKGTKFLSAPQRLKWGEIA